MKMFSVIFPPGSRRSLPQNQSIVNSEKPSFRTGFSRFSRDRLGAIADNGHVSHGVFLFFPFFSPGLAGAAAWRSLFTSSREKTTSDRSGAQRPSALVYVTMPKSVRVSLAVQQQRQCVNAIRYTGNDSARRTALSTVRDTESLLARLVPRTIATYGAR